MLSFITYLDCGCLSQEKKKERKKKRRWISVSMIDPWSPLIRFIQRDDHPLNSPIRSSLGLGLFYLLREHQPAIVFLVSLCQSMRNPCLYRETESCLLVQAVTFILAPPTKHQDWQESGQLSVGAS